MERALRVISVERGHDPRYYSLLSFGGAGSLHAADLARSLGIPRVIVPPLASTLSAFGMLAADVVKDYTQTVMLPGDIPMAELSARLELLARRGREDLLAEGVNASDIHLESFLDMRYQGQSYELIVPFSDTVFDEFHSIHEQQYGYAKKTGLVEVVNLRLQAIGRTLPPPLLPRSLGDSDPSPALLEARQVFFDSGPQMSPLYQAEKLTPGNRIDGPAVTIRSDTTILLCPGDKAFVDAFENLVIEVAS
jgi:N-methylhydantoinase A